MDYIALSFTCANALTAELLMADLEGLPVESVTQEGLQVNAYVMEGDYHQWTLANFPLAA